MINAMGLILSGGKNDRLKELSTIRSVAAIPVGGKYRAIDFTLSNMVNSGVKNIGIPTQYSFRSLMDHLGSGKEWDLDRRTDGLFIFPPYLSGDDSGWYRGTADAMYNNLTFLKRSNEEYAIITHGNCVFKMNFEEMIEYHKAKEADITIAYRVMDDFSKEDLSLLGLLSIDETGKVNDMQEKPQNPWTNTCSMGIYILKRELLIYLLEESAARGNYDFVKDILIRHMGMLKIFAYKFNGYWRNLSTIQLYYKCNMELLNPEIRQELFIEGGKVYTKVKDETPAKYNEEADVTNSIIADGCIIEGTVQNSVLFRGVTVKRGAVIKDSIVMQGTTLEENSSIQNTILDKNVIITSGKNIKGDLNWPIIVGKNIRV